MSKSYDPKLVHLPGTKLTPQVTLKCTLEDVREDKDKRRVDGYVIMPDGRTRRGVASKALKINRENRLNCATNSLAGMLGGSLTAPGHLHTEGD